jgi:predicted metal-dependent hydrolase
MLLFRSEQHIDRWCRQWNRRRGGILSLDQGWRLAQAWYGDRFSPDRRAKTGDEVQALFAEIGLRGPFWRLKR